MYNQNCWWQEDKDKCMSDEICNISPLYPPLPLCSNRKPVTDPTGECDSVIFETICSESYQYDWDDRGLYCRWTKSEGCTPGGGSCLIQDTN